MLGKMKTLLADDSGAVTVDWVVLTAGIVAINIGIIIGSFQEAMELAASDVSLKATQANAN